MENPALAHGASGGTDQAAKLIDPEITRPSPQRQRPANKRYSENSEADWRGQKYTYTTSRYADGRLAEIFIDGKKAGSEATIHAQDCAVLISILLQVGIPAHEIAHSISGPLATVLRQAGGAR